VWEKRARGGVACVTLSEERRGKDGERRRETVTTPPGLWPQYRKENEGWGGDDEWGEKIGRALCMGSSFSVRRDNEPPCSVKKKRRRKEGAQKKNRRSPGVEKVLATEWNS